MLAFKCVKGLAPSYLSDRLVTRSTVHDRNTRNKDYLNIPSHQLAAGQRTFLYREILLWNSLLCAITAADSLHTFKKKLREYFFLNHFLSARGVTYSFDVFVYYYDFNA